MKKGRIGRSAASVVMAVALFMNGLAPGYPFVSTVHAEGETNTITPSKEESEDPTRSGTGQMEIKLKIRGKITPTVSLEGWTAGESPKTPAVTGNTGNGAVTYTYQVNKTGDYTETVPTTSGTHSVKATIAETDLYEGGVAETDFVIAPKDTTSMMTITLSIHKHSFKYAASGATITATCREQTGTCDLPGNKVSLTLHAPAKTSDADSNSAAATFDSEELAAFNEATGLDVSAVDVKYEGRGSTSYEESATAPTTEGTYTAKLAVAELDAPATVDYAIASSTQTKGMTITLVIKEKASVTTAPAANTLSYTGEAQALVTAGVATGGTMLYRLGTDGEYSEEIPKAAAVGTYQVYYKVKGDENHRDSDESATPVTVQIGKAANTVTVSITGWTYGGYDSNVNAPTATATQGIETVSYTYSDSKNGIYTATVPEKAGTYYVKATVAETENYDGAESEPVSFVISPKALTDDMLALSADSFEHDENKAYTPTITVKDGATVLVKDTDYTIDSTSTISATEYGDYIIKVNGKGNYTGSVSVGWEITDNKAPEIEITIKESSIKTAFNAITFGWFFNESETVTITATDTGSGVDKIYYFTSGTAVSSVEELIALAGNSWTEGKSFSKNPNAKFIVYAKVTDKKGNTGYAASNGVVLDNTKPVVQIDGANAQTEYHKAVSWTAEDENLDNVVIMFTTEGETAGTEIVNKSTTPGEAQLVGDSSLSELGSYTITAKDKAENKTEVTFAITGRAAEITGKNESTDFVAGKTYDLSQLFEVEKGVNISSFAIVANADTDGGAAGEAGDGTIDGDQLTIKKAGLITIKATVAKGQTVPAASETAVEYIKETTAAGTLSVGKAEGSAGITVADTVYGNGITALISSSTNAAASSKITYTMTADAAGKEIPEANRTESETKPVGVGTYKAVVTYEATGLYKEVSAECTFKITPAVLTVTAEAKEKIYGGTDPAFTYTVSGLQYEDKADSVLSGALTRAEGENAGTYAITQGTLKANENYTIRYTGADLTINKATLTVTAEAKERAYGKDDPELTYQVSGLENGDTAEKVLTGALTRESGEDVGTYAITQGTLAANGNYTISFTGADFKITKTEATVTAPEANNLTYNGKAQALVKAGAAEGGEMQYALGTDAETAPEADAENTPEAEKKWSTSIPTGIDAGTYYVWYKAVGDANHTGSTAKCITVKVAKAAITITADDKSSQYKADLAELTWKIGGAYVADDKFGITASTTAGNTANVGEYPITLSWNENPNYEATLVEGKYRITKTGLTVTATDYTGKYDGKAHGITVNVGESDAVVYYGTEKELTAENYKTAGSTTAPLRTDAGKTTVYYYVESANYTPDTVYGSKDIEIAKADALADADLKDGEKATANTLTYNEKAQTLVTAPAGIPTGYTKVQYSLDGTTWTDTIPTGTAAGSYTVHVKYLADANHTDFEATPVNVVIAKAAVADKTVTDVAEVSSAGVKDKTIDLKDYLVAGAALAQKEATDGTPAGAKVETAGALASLITPGTLKEGVFTYSVAENDGGLTGQMILTISSLNYADYTITINLESSKKVTEVVVESEGVDKTETAVKTVEVPTLEDFTEAQPEATVEVKMEVKLESAEKVTEKIGTAALSRIEESVTKAFGGVSAANLAKEYLDVTVTKSVDGGAAQTVADVNRVLEIKVGYNLTGKHNPVVIREHGGAVSQFTRLSARPVAGSYQDGSFYVEGSGADAAIYIYARYFSTYTVAYTTTASYQVTFDDAAGDTAQGTQSNITQVVVTTGSKMTKPADPTRDGYDFAGWFIDGTDTAWNFDTAVTSDLVLKAKWNERDDDDDDEKDIGKAEPVVTKTPRSPMTNDDLMDYSFWMIIVAAGFCIGAVSVKMRKEEQE